MRATCIAMCLAAAFLGMGLCALAQTSRPQGSHSAPKKAAVAGESSPSSVETGTADDSTASLPVVKIEFKDQPAIPGAAAFHVYAGPILCSPDGIPFVDVINAPDFMEHTVYSLGSKQAIAFSAKAIPGLFDVSLMGYFVADSFVGFLVHATADSTLAANKMTIIPGTPPRNIYKGKHLDYVVEFDRAGNYKKTLDLPTAYDFKRIGALADDSLLAVAYDRVNAVARLLLLDSGGQIIRPLEVPAQMAMDPGLKQGESGDEVKRMNAASSLSWWLFAPVQQKTLLYQAHTKSPVLEVGAGGVAREVPLQAPKGYVLDGVISANDRWVMRYRKEGLSDYAAIDARPEAKNFVLYEVNPSDGSLKRQIEIQARKNPPFAISCEQDGVFTSFSMDDERVILQTAELPH